MAVGVHVPISQEAVDHLLRSVSDGTAHIPHVIFIVPTAEFKIDGSLADGLLTITRKEHVDEPPAS